MEAAVLGGVYEATRYIPRTTGPAWYVNAVTGNDLNGGSQPQVPFLTIGAALAVATAGSVIVISAGSYDENGLDISVDGVELLGEMGSILVDTTTGTQTLLISGDSCRVRGLHIAQAAQIGVKVTGAACWLEDVECNGGPTTAFDIDGDYTIMRRCSAVLHTATGFDISSARCWMEGCTAIGNGSATRGVYLSAVTADYNVLKDVATAGNATNGYYVVAGASFNTFNSCSSGGGDGNRLDLGTSTVWAQYSFDSVLHKSITITSALSYNLFKVTGVVKIRAIWGIISTAIGADVTNARLDLFPTGGAAIPLSSAAGVNISSAVTNSQLIKDGLANTALHLNDATLGFLNEVSGGDSEQSFDIGQKTGGVEMHIRFTRAGAGTGGVIDWHVDWCPCSDDGFLAVA
jgi:hypothetical protein